MKKLAFYFVLGWTGLLFAGTWVGCSKSTPKVDVTAMIQDLKKPDNETRVNACMELAKAGPQAAPAVSALIPLLKDPDPVLRRLAAYTLGSIGKAAAPALPSLRELLNDPNREAVSAAVNALGSIDPKSGNPQIPNVMGR